MPINEKSKDAENNMPTISFYSKERWQNWIDQVKDSKFKIEDHEQCEIFEDNCEIFVNMTDDIILVCLKLIYKYDKGLINKDDANKYLTEMKAIVLEKIDPINSDVDAMLESTQLSLMAIFASCDTYINKTFERTKSFGTLINNYLLAEEKNDMVAALNIIATIGANVLSGETLSAKDLDKITSEGDVAEWLDGIDSLGVAMMGETKQK